MDHEALLREHFERLMEDVEEEEWGDNPFRKECMAEIEKLGNERGACRDDTMGGKGSALGSRGIVEVDGATDRRSEILERLGNTTHRTEADLPRLINECRSTDDRCVGMR